MCQNSQWKIKKIIQGRTFPFTLPRLLSFSIYFTRTIFIADVSLEITCQTSLNTKTKLDLFSSLKFDSRFDTTRDIFWKWNIAFQGVQANRGSERINWTGETFTNSFTLLPLIISQTTGANAYSLATRRSSSKNRLHVILHRVTQLATRKPNERASSLSLVAERAFDDRNATSSAFLEGWRTRNCDSFVGRSKK